MKDTCMVENEKKDIIKEYNLPHRGCLTKSIFCEITHVCSGHGFVVPP